MHDNIATQDLTRSLETDDTRCILKGRNSELAAKVLASPFESLRKRYFLNSVTWKKRRRTRSQEIGQSKCFKRENLNSSLEQQTCLDTLGGGK
jgi:hypothetical protein